MTRDAVGFLGRGLQARAREKGKRREDDNELDSFGLLCVLNVL